MKGYRIPMVLGTLCLLVVAGIIIANSRSQNTAGAVDGFLAAVLQVQFTNQKLAPMGVNSFYELTGEITNNSDYSFAYAGGDIEVWDCPTETLSATCTHIGQYSNVILSMDGSAYPSENIPGAPVSQFPPGLVREATASFPLDGMPPIQGHMVWVFGVTRLFENPNDVTI